MDAPDELKQSKEGDKTAHLMEALGGLLVVALVIWFLFYYFVREPAKDVSGADERTTSITKIPTKEEMLDQMSTKAEIPVVVSENEKKKMFEAMSRQVSTTGTVLEVPQTTTPAPTVTPLQRQKMLDAMQQKAP